MFAAVLVAAFAAVSSARAQDAGPDNAAPENAAAPENGTWVPSTSQTFTYVVPYTTGTILVGPFVTRVSNGVALIPGSAFVRVCFPASSCTDNFPVTVSFPTTNSAIMTVTNIPLLGTGQTMEFTISPVTGQPTQPPPPVRAPDRAVSADVNAHV